MGEAGGTKRSKTDPCNGCEERHFKCHSTCRRYKIAKLVGALRLSRKYKELETERFVIEHYHRVDVLSRYGRRKK